MSELLEDDAREYRKRLKSLIRLASSNFPRNTHIGISTLGSDPHASMSIPPGVLLKLIGEKDTPS